jgi:hypothetical protein
LKDFADSSAKLTELQAVLNKAQREVDTDMGDADAKEEVQKLLFVSGGQSSTDTEAPPIVSVTKPDGTETPSPGGLFVPDNKATITFEHATSTSDQETPDTSRGTTDFGRWTPAEEDEENMFTPKQAREAAGLETDGEIVAWVQHGNCKPVVVTYGPRNAWKYKRLTAFRESDMLDELSTPRFGPNYRYGDAKVDGKLISK